MSCVLPACGVATDLTLELLGEVMSGETTSCAPAEVGACDQPDGLAVALGEGVVAGPSR
jgi:hypothetical protein